MIRKNNATRLKPFVILPLLGIFPLLTSCGPSGSTAEPAPREKPASETANGATTPSLATRSPASAGIPLDPLLDQNGRKFERRENSGLVLVRASQKNGDAMTPWSDDLFVRLPSTCQFVRVLDLKGMPHAMSPVISRTIRLQLGKDNESVSIYLDWEGSVARRYDCEGTDPAVICMDSNDTVLNTVRGGWTKESADLVIGLYP